MEKIHKYMEKIISILLAVTLIAGTLTLPSVQVRAAEHIHTADCYNGHNHAISGCKQHIHTGNSTDGGECYEITSHKHTGDCQPYEAVCCDTVTGVINATYATSYCWTITFTMPCGNNVQLIHYSASKPDGYGDRLRWYYVTLAMGGKTLYTHSASPSYQFPTDGITNDFQAQMRSLCSSKGVSMNTNGAELEISFRDLKKYFSKYMGSYSYLTSFVCFDESCTGEKSVTYQCGMAAGEPVYEPDCGFSEGEWECGFGNEEAAPVCDMVVTGIEPEPFSAAYGFPVEAATAAAAYLDGHTGMVGVTTDYDPEKAAPGESKEYTAVYTGKVNTASEDAGTIEAPITIHTEGVQAFTLSKKQQIIYKGEEPDCSGIADFGSAGTKMVKGTCAGMNENLTGKEQTVTVTYDGGSVVTDTLQLIILPRPVKITASDVETTKGTDKEVVLKVDYEDGTKKELSFRLSESEKIYTDTCSLGEITTALAIQWENKNEGEAGTDYQSGGEYVLKIEYQGISTNINVKVSDSCSNDLNHAEFTHDVCPVCKFVKEHEAEYFEATAGIGQVKQLLQSNIEEMEAASFPEKETLLKRHQEKYQELKEIWEISGQALKEQLIHVTDTLETSVDKWSEASDINEIEGTFEEVLKVYEQGRNIAETAYNSAMEALAEAEALKEKKEKIDVFLPEIIINSPGEKIYDGKELRLEAEATTEESDMDFVNPVEFYVFGKEGWEPVRENTLITAGEYLLKAVTTDRDYKIVEKEFQAVIYPKELVVTTKETTSPYGELPELVLEYSGFVNGETEADIAEAVHITAEAVSTKAGRQPVKITVSLTGEKCNYEVKGLDGVILFTVPEGYEKIELPFLKEGSPVLVDGVEKILEAPYEIWHPTDKKIVVQQAGTKWEISTDGKATVIKRTEISLSGGGGGGISTGTSRKEDSSGGKAEAIWKENQENKLSAADGLRNDESITVGEDGLVYINARELEAKEGYLLSDRIGNWRPSITTGKVGFYDSYDFYLYNTKAHTISDISFYKTCVDYVEPKARLNSSDKTIKVNKGSKNRYLASTKAKKLTFTTKADFGVSGRKAVKYQFVKKGRAVSNTWKTVKGNVIKRIPGSYEVLHVKFLDKAGNATTLKTYGYQSDKDKPKINVKNKKTYKKNTKLKVKDKKSGISKISLNGKTVKNGYVFRKNGTYRLIATDKAGNTAKVTIKIK